MMMKLQHYHSDSLQVDLGAAQLLPAVMPVALPLGHAAELSGGLEHVSHQRTATHLVCRHLRQETSVSRLYS